MAVKKYTKNINKYSFEFGKPKRYGKSLSRQKSMTYLDYLRKSEYKNKNFWITRYKSYAQKNPVNNYKLW